MPKYLSKVNYTKEGFQGLLKEGGANRRESVRKFIESGGGKMESFYFAFGDQDVYIISEVESEVKAAAMSLVVNAAGAASVQQIQLLTPEEIDKAIDIMPKYSPPGE